MTNAKKELLEHIEGREVLAVSFSRAINYDFPPPIVGTLEEVLPLLDFVYDSGFGSQEIEGTIWYTDGTWSARGEYDGSEWWEHHQCPPLPERFV